MSRISGGRCRKPQEPSRTVDAIAIAGSWAISGCWTDEAVDVKGKNKLHMILLTEYLTFYQPSLKENVCHRRNLVMIFSSRKRPGFPHESSEIRDIQQVVRLMPTVYIWTKSFFHQSTQRRSRQAQNPYSGVARSGLGCRDPLCIRG
jgi:hypothetical protein